MLFEHVAAVGMGKAGTINRPGSLPLVLLPKCDRNALYVARVSKQNCGVICTPVLRTGG